MPLAVDLDASDLYKHVVDDGDRADRLAQCSRQRRNSRLISGGYLIPGP